MPDTLSTSLRRSVAALFVMCIALVTVGCAETGGSKQYSVSGSVTLDDIPVADGQINFRHAKTGKSTSGMIKDGKYDLKAEAGEMKVEIVASRVIPGKFDTTTNPGTQEPVSEMYIPKIYNSETTLVSTVEAKTNDIPFKLTSVKKK